MDEFRELEAVQALPASALKPDLIRIIDPRTNVCADDGRAHIVRQGGQQVQPRVEPASSFSDSQIVWNFQPPSTTTIVSRSWRVKLYVTLTATGGDFEIGLNDAPKMFPVTSITDTAQLSVNGSSVSVQMDHANALLTMNNTPGDRQKYWTATPSMPTQFQEYADWNTYGTGRNALADYGEVLSEETRGGFPHSNLAGNIARYEFTEPVLLEPLTQVGEDEGFVNVNQFSLVLTLRSPLSLLWSHASSGNPITSIAVSFHRTPELLFDQFTPLPLQHIPQRQIFGYVQPQIFRKTIGTVTAGSVAANTSSDTLRLGMVPRHIVVFAQRSRGTQSFDTTQNFAGIDRISVQWDNQASLLSTASPQELWQMSARNGSNLTWSQWAKFRGAVAIISLPGDIGLPQDLTSGTVGQFALQLTVDFRNLNTSDMELEFFVVLMNEGVVSVVPNGASFTLGMTTRQMVLDARGAPEVPPQMHVQLAGGSLFSGAKSFAHKLASVLAKAGKWSAAAAPLLTAVNPTLGAVATGLGAVGRSAEVVRKATAPSSGGRMSGGYMSGGAPSGGAISGGYHESPVLQLARGRLQRRFVG